MSAGKIVLRFIAALVGLALVAAAAWIGVRTWPRPLPQPDWPQPPAVVLYGDRVALRIPTDTLAARVASFHNQLSAYLYCEFLRTAPPVRGAEVLFGKKETADGTLYSLYVLVDNDLLHALPYLGNLVASRLISGFELLPSSARQVSAWELQTTQLDAAYHAPVRRRLELLSAAQLLPPLIRFLRFKADTDPRVIAGMQPPVLSEKAARLLAGDIVRVARFYDLPLDSFLGIAAMENNYMNVTGDLAHKVWKRHAQKGDIVLERRRGRVLVLNYSLGVWQITRETLRYAHALYLRDHRDYRALPAALRPPEKLDLDHVAPRTLTTYAGLLFRDLLDRFHGNVRMAVGAYNGGFRHPEPNYAAGVETVAAYARRILEHAAMRTRPAVADASAAAYSWHVAAISQVENSPAAIPNAAGKWPQ